MISRDAWFVPSLSRLFPVTGTIPQKGIKSAKLVLAPTEVLFTPRALFPSSSSGTLSTENTSFQFFGKTSSAPLCSCSGAGRQPLPFDRPIARTYKNPRAYAAVSGSLHKLAPTLAWVCCPLIGSSLTRQRCVMRLSRFATRRSRWQRGLYPRPSRPVNQNWHRTDPGKTWDRPTLPRVPQAVVGALSASGVASAVSRCGRKRPSSCGLGMKPTIRSTASPPLNRIMVGMPVTPNCIGVS